MAALQVTPIAAHMHWDDQKQIWKLKASRQTKEGGKFKEWEPLFEFAGDLATILSLLMAFWQIVNSGVFNATAGDLEALGALMAGGAHTPEVYVPVALPASTEYTGTVLDGTEFDGTAMHPAWGVTAG